MMSLFAFQRHLQFSELPPSTRQTLKRSLLDILGIAAAARDTLATRALTRYALEHYPSGALASRLFFDGRQAHPLGASWVGGFCVDSIDAHEGHFASKGHAGATVVPALFALVDASRERGRTISGEEFLSALCIGYESALRAGSALMATTQDYHASGAFSGVGVVCAGARLMGLDETHFRHALGIAEYFGPRCPMMRLIDHPSMLRDAHGAGAFSGVNALMLAQAGLTGAPASTVEDEGVAPFWGDLGERWEIDAQYFKLWPVCRWAQPALTAVSQMMTSCPGGIEADAIEHIRVETFHESMRLQGHVPASSDEAQYGLAFPLAAMIIRGHLGAGEVNGEALHDEQILSLCQRIEIVEVADLSARFPAEILSRVHLTFKNGRRLSSDTVAAKGDPESPLSQADMLEKFRDLAGEHLADERLAAIIGAVDTLEQAEDCTALMNLVLEA